MRTVILLLISISVFAQESIYKEKGDSIVMPFNGVLQSEMYEANQLYLIDQFKALQDTTKKYMASNREIRKNLEERLKKDSLVIALGSASIDSLERSKEYYKNQADNYQKYTHYYKENYEKKRKSLWYHKIVIASCLVLLFI